MVGHVQIDGVIAQASQQRELIRQSQTVFHEQCLGRHLVGLVLDETWPGTGNIIEVPRVVVVRVYGTFARHVQRAVSGAVDLVLKTAGPSGGEAEDARVMAQFELVAVLLALMPHLIGRRAVHRAVVGVVLVGLQVAVVALAVEVVEGIFQCGAVVDPVVDDRACPDRALLITAVGYVVVIEAVVLVDLQLTGLGVEHRRAPVRAVFMFVLILQGQGVGQVRGEVAEQGKRHAPGIALVAVDVAVVGVAAYIQAGVMLHLGAGFGQRMVEAERHTGGVVTAIAQLALDGLFLAACQLGHVVQRATH